MNSYEKSEVDLLPEKYRPMGAWGYVGYSLLFSLGLIGFICAMVFAFNNEYIARRNYARGVLIVHIIACVVCIILILAFGGVLLALISQLPQG